MFTQVPVNGQATEPKGPIGADTWAGIINLEGMVLLAGHGGIGTGSDRTKAVQKGSSAIPKCTCPLAIRDVTNSPNVRWAFAFRVSAKSGRQASHLKYSRVPARKMSAI